MKSRRAVILSVLALLAGCADNVKPFAGLVRPAPGKAVLYIYRVDLDVQATLIAPNVRINQQSIGPLTRSGYFRVELDPGPAHVALYRLDRSNDQIKSDTFWPANRDVVVNLNLAPDTTRFVQFTLDWRTFNFREVSHDVALHGLSDLSPLN